MAGQGDLEAKHIVKATAAAIAVGAYMGVMAAAPTVNTEVAVDKLELPWDMAFMKDGTMFFTEKCNGLSVRLTVRARTAATPNG